MIYANDPQTNSFNEWIRSYGIYIAIAVAGVVFLTVVILFTIAMIKRRKNPEGAIPREYSSSYESNKVLEAIGGVDNIISHSLNGSRIVLMLKNYEVVNEKMLNENGVDTVIKMSNKITLVVKRDSSKLYKELFH